MSWGAVDDRFHGHRKVLRLRRGEHYAAAVAIWTLALSWCCAQEQERFTGKIPYDVLAGFGIPDWEKAAAALIDVGLWDAVDIDTARFHDWGDWNGIGGKEYRAKENARLRQQAHRKARCEAGQHDRHCPSDTCPRKLARAAGNGGSRDPGSGRDGSGRVGTGKGSSYRDEETHTQASPSRHLPGNRSPRGRSGRSRGELLSGLRCDGGRVRCSPGRVWSPLLSRLRASGGRETRVRGGLFEQVSDTPSDRCSEAISGSGARVGNADLNQAEPSGRRLVRAVVVTLRAESGLVAQL